jgi:conjugal transfer pilus assembly protein TraB
VNIKLSLAQRWASLPSGKKRMYLMGLGGAVFLLGCVIISQNRNSGPITQVNPADKYKLVNPDMAKEVLAEKLTRDIADLRSEMRSLHEENRKLRDELANTPISGGTPGDASASGVGTSTAHEREMGLRRQLQGMGALPVEKGGDLYPPIPAQPKIPGAVSPPVLPQSGGAQSVVIPPTPQAQTAVIPAPTQQSPARVAVAEPRVMGALRFSQAKQDQRPAGAGYAPAGAAGGEGGTDAQALAQSKTGKQESSPYYNFYIPTSTHFKVRLITGLDAPTGPKASGQPHPVILRVQDLSFLPNNVRQDIAGCHLLGEAIGELSSERARVRGLNLSCVDDGDNQVIDESVEGFVADSDGKASLRGRVVSKQGRFLANALLAAFVEGLGKGFQGFGTTTYVGAYGTATSSDMDTFTDGFKSGVGSGMSTAAQKLSEFYLKAAEDLYPVIEITANREATFITTKGKRFTADKKIFLPVAVRAEETKASGNRDDKL